MAIELEDISFTYGNNVVLHNVSFKIENKDFVGIIGSNGSGKTTLLKIMLGLLKPSKGTIRIFNKTVEDAIKNKEIGYVPQRYNVDNNFPATVKELLSFNGNKRVTSLLGINELLNKKFSELSGGQQQKVLIALSLRSNPKVLFLDEPTVGIDMTSQREFYDFLKKLSTQMKVAIVLVSHDIGVISKYVNKVILVSDKICIMGKTDEARSMLKKAYGEEFEVFHHHH